MLATNSIVKFNFDVRVVSKVNTFRQDLSVKSMLSVVVVETWSSSPGLNQISDFVSFYEEMGERSGPVRSHESAIVISRNTVNLHRLHILTITSIASFSEPEHCMIIDSNISLM